MNDLFFLGLLSLIAGSFGFILAFQFRALGGLGIPGMPSMGPKGLIIPREVFIELGLLDGKKRYKLQIRKISIVLSVFSASFGVALLSGILSQNKVFTGLVSFFSFFSSIGTMLDVLFNFKLNDGIRDLFQRSRNSQYADVTKSILSAFKQSNITINSLEDLASNIDIIAHLLPYAYGTPDDSDDSSFQINLHDLKGDKTLTTKGYMELQTYLMKNLFPHSTTSQKKTTRRRTEKKNKKKTKKQKRNGA